MDEDLRRLERLAKGGDEHARERWREERARRGMCAGGLDACRVGIHVVMDRPGVAELWWGREMGGPLWTWSLDRLEDQPGYPEELATLLNSQNPMGLSRDGMLRFVFRPTPFGVLAFGPCHACEKPVRDPQEVVIDDGPRWGSRVPLWLRRSSEFKAAVAQTGKNGPGTPDRMQLRTILDIPTPWELVPLPLPDITGRLRPEPRPRMRYELEWEPWLCPCGERAGRVLVKGDPATAAPFIKCPWCGARGYEHHDGEFTPVRWWRAPVGDARARRGPPPTSPPAPSPPARSGS